MLTDTDIEKEIVNAGLTAPRVTLDSVNAILEQMRYEHWVVPNTTNIVVAGILPNDFVVALGTASTVSKENFDLSIGLKIATNDCLTNARNKIWELEGYALSKQLNSVPPNSTCRGDYDYADDDSDYDA